MNRGRGAIAPDPKGAAHGCAAFSDRARMASRKILAGPVHRDGRSVEEAVSFGYFSLGEQRKVTRRQAKAVAVALRIRGEHPKLPPLLRRVTFLCWCKVRVDSLTLKKSPILLTTPSRATSCFRRDLSTRVPAVSKNAAHPCAVPSGSGEGGHVPACSWVKGFKSKAAAAAIRDT